MRYLLIILLVSCNPVKRVMNNDQMFKQVADSVIARGYCITDTVQTYEVLETTEYIEIDGVPCPDFVKGTVVVNSGVLKVPCLQKTTTLVKTVRDISRENQLKQIISKNEAELKRLKGVRNYNRIKLFIAFLSGLIASRIIKKRWT